MIPQWCNKQIRVHRIDFVDLISMLCWSKLWFDYMKFTAEFILIAIDTTQGKKCIMWELKGTSLKDFF